MLYF
jgi:hypothetical protein